MQKADQEMFHTLSTTATGKQLIDYLTRMQNDICDSRQWEELETRSSSTQAARHIQKLIDKISLRDNNINTPHINEFE